MFGTELKNNFTPMAIWKSIVDNVNAISGGGGGGTYLASTNIFCVYVLKPLLVKKKKN